MKVGDKVKLGLEVGTVVSLIPEGEPNAGAPLKVITENGAIFIRPAHYKPVDA